jgi:hypothetical protein
MFGKVLCRGAVVLGLIGGVTASAAPPTAPPPHRPVVRWPGGWMYLDEPGVIYHDGTAPDTGSTTIVAGSANGVGNRIVIDNGNSSGVTVLWNVRNGVGNSVAVTPAGPGFESPPGVTVPARAKK